MAQYDADKDEKMSPTEFQKFVSWHFPHPVSFLAIVHVCTAVSVRDPCPQSLQQKLVVLGPTRRALYCTARASIDTLPTVVDGGARTPMAMLKKRKQRSATQRGPHVSSGTRAAAKSGT